MKSIFKYSLLATLLLTLACNCKKDKTDDNLLKNPGLEMDINGQRWNSDTILIGSSNDFKFTIGGVQVLDRIDPVSNFHYQKEGISFYTLKKKISKQLVRGTALINVIINNAYATIDSPTYSRFFTTYEDGEALCAGYRVDNNDSLNNWVEILKQEDNYKKVWGRFQMTLYKDSQDQYCTTNTYPDTLRITNGRFYAVE